MLYEFTPVYPDSIRYSLGKDTTKFTEYTKEEFEQMNAAGKSMGLEISLDFLLGRENIIIHKDREGREIKREFGTPNKTIIYGVVTECGLECERNTTNVFDVDKRDPNFPLPPGTLVKVTNSMDHTTGPKEKAYSTWDSIEYKLQGEPHKMKVWGLLTEKLAALVKQAQDEACEA
jgi:hypothetical protein